MSHSAKISNFPIPAERLAPPTERVVIPGIAGTDPAQEIRNLIEQLQVAAREAQARQQMAEEERDQLRLQLQGLQKELATLEGMGRQIAELEHERDALREQQKSYGELVATLKTKLDVSEYQRRDALKQRDNASGLFKKAQHTIEETARGRDEAIRHRDAAIRQRDAAVKERDDFAAKLQESNGLLAEAHRALIEAQRGAGNARKAEAEIQRQILSLRQARDNAAAQTVELKARIGQLEDELAALGYERDGAVEKANKAEAALKALQAAVSEQQSEHMKTAAALAELRAEMESLRGQYGEAVLERDARGKKISELSGTISDLKKRNTTLKKRNAAFAMNVQEAGEKIRELRVEVERRTGEVESLRNQVAAVLKERDAALARIQEQDAQLESLSAAAVQAEEAERARAEELNAAREQVEATVRQLNEALVERDAAVQERDQAISDRANALQPLEEAKRSLAAAREQIEHIVRERAMMQENAAALEAEIVRLNTELSNASMAAKEGAAIATSHEKMRLQMIEVTAQLATAQHQIRELSAALAEARLQVRQPRTSATWPIGESFSAARNTIAAMRQCCQRFTCPTGDAAVLEDLHTHVKAFMNGSATAGQRTLHRIAMSLNLLLKSLRESPRTCGELQIKTVTQAIELLASLTSERDLDQRVNLEGARAYVVEDDREMCNALAETLNAADIQTRTALSASTAIAELAGNRYDIVLIDVFLPDLNGFELCSHIRNMTLHARTPVLFVSGEASVENLIEASQCEEAEFLPKPVRREELVMRTLTCIAKSQISS